MNAQSQFMIDELKSKVHQLETNLSSLKRVVEKLEKESGRPDYSQVDGVVGKYDGYKMVSDDGKSYEVPANYAAKTKLVYGDTLKLIEENDKKLFKQIDRVERTKIEGILTKKEGEWYLLTDRGSYKVSDTAAEFQSAQLNSQATALLPTNKMDAPFATLDVVEGFGMNTKASQPVETPEPVQAQPKKPKKEYIKKPVSTTQRPTEAVKTPKPRSKRPAVGKSREYTPRRESTPEPVAPTTSSAPTTKSEILDDDLV